MNFQVQLEYIISQPRDHDEEFLDFDLEVLPDIDLDLDFDRLIDFDTDLLIDRDPDLLLDLDNLLETDLDLLLEFVLLCDLDTLRGFDTDLDFVPSFSSPFPLGLSQASSGDDLLSAGVYRGLSLRRFVERALPPPPSLLSADDSAAAFLFLLSTVCDAAAATAPWPPFLKRNAL